MLGPHGYVVGAPGKNELCHRLVERAWFSGLTDDAFWDTKLRAPDCYNAAAARSVLPVFLKRTQWALAGATRAQIRARTEAAIKAGKIRAPEQGALNYMLSKEGNLGPNANYGPWRPHIMFFMPPKPLTEWGANTNGRAPRCWSSDPGIDPYSMLYIPVAAWSDGTPAAGAGAHHTM